ncbi:MAG: type IV toxin-antitoxin system AbiEi family antitoxin domain-containing protein [Actinobacteria bacterium]|nr:type IV toxin-antitoxin system AbiEi family antitoxin domain-containing protein [Actinomycetota bacterium]MBU1609273.1 type IV toxin-antitoxin system AbiEi family antitoxin domain-containing protein [Actinomycetota bacterium]MBU2314905.1 type IV toxin-antitoxin system AbiEi family antitoxin domain-containing protein [Actinomycetota bacterium]MBU2383992.1 type IV toxin-antitoxin system AbiEi family antitoxin domain-containing protein [Actinomycetota bacterium]
MDALTPFSRHATICLTRRQLLAHGLTPRQLAAAVARGTLVRPRRGLYVPAHTARGVVAALHVGGPAACVTAVETYGIWTPDRRLVHVWLKPNAARLRALRLSGRTAVGEAHHELRRHWRPLLESDQCESWRVGVLDALIQVVRCQPRAIAIAVLDSALHQGVIERQNLEQLAVQVTSRQRRVFDRIDARAESGTESLVRLALVDAGLRVVPQVLFPGVGRVDLLVEGRIVVEVDSAAWHSTVDAVTRDYGRDLQLVRRRRWVVRVSYEQAMHSRRQVVEAVRAALRASRAS